MPNLYALYPAEKYNAILAVIAPNEEDKQSAAAFLAQAKKPSPKPPKKYSDRIQCLNLIFLHGVKTETLIQIPDQLHIIQRIDSYKSTTKIFPLFLSHFALLALDLDLPTILNLPNKKEDELLSPQLLEKLDMQSKVSFLLQNAYNSINSQRPPGFSACRIRSIREGSWWRFGCRSYFQRHFADASQEAAPTQEQFNFRRLLHFS